MAITFEQIMKANEGLTGIDVKGKNYIMVPQRVKAFRMLYPDGFIHTDLISLQDGVCVMQTKVGYYEDGKEVVLGTGMAYEKETNGYINKTSYIENCETSAVGRALGFLALGIDGGGICSAEELANAINNQDKDFPKQVNSVQEVPKRQDRKDAPAVATVVASVPGSKPKDPVKDYIANEITFMKQMFGIESTADMNKRFMEMRKSLIEAKVIPDIPSDKQTMEQAKDMIDAIYKNFTPSGEQK